MGIGLLVMVNAFSKQMPIKPTQNINATKSNDKNEIEELEQQEPNPYECGYCNGTGKDWICSNCRRTAEWNVYIDFFDCNSCRDTGSKYKIIDVDCIACNGRGVF